MGDFQQVNKGDKITADGWNKIVSALNNAQDAAFNVNGVPTGRKPLPGEIVQIRNDSGATIQAGEAVAVTGFLGDSAGTIKSAREFWLNCGFLFSASGRGAYGVYATAQESIPAGGIGKAIIPGIQCGRVYFGDALITAGALLDKNLSTVNIGNSSYRESRYQVLYSRDDDTSGYTSGGQALTAWAIFAPFVSRGQYMLYVNDSQSRSESNYEVAKFIDFGYGLYFTDSVSSGYVTIQSGIRVNDFRKVLRINTSEYLTVTGYSGTAGDSGSSVSSGDTPYGVVNIDWRGIEVSGYWWNWSAGSESSGEVEAQHSTTVKSIVFYDRLFTKIVDGETAGVGFEGIHVNCPEGAAYRDYSSNYSTAVRNLIFSGNANVVISDDGNTALIYVPYPSSDSSGSGGSCGCASQWADLATWKADTTQTISDLQSTVSTLQAALQAAQTTIASQGTRISNLETMLADLAGENVVTGVACVDGEIEVTYVTIPDTGSAE